MKPLLLVKLGGSVITDKSKPFTPRMDVIERLAREIHEARQERDFNLIVGHGGGSFPHTSAKKYQVHKGYLNEESYKGIAVVQNDAAKLNRIIVDAFLRAGENAISVQPSASALALDGRIKFWNLHIFKEMLDRNLLPVTYGDVGLDLNKMCCILSTEEILHYISDNMMPEKVIMAGSVDGVMSADPTKDPNAKLFKEITQENFEEVKKCLSGSYGIDVTGGMVQKVQKALEMAKRGFVIEIINVLKEGYLKRALLGEEGLGTVIRWKKE